MMDIMAVLDKLLHQTHDEDTYISWVDDDENKGYFVIQEGDIVTPYIISIELGKIEVVE